MIDASSCYGWLLSLERIATLRLAGPKSWCSKGKSPKKPWLREWIGQAIGYLVSKRPLVILPKDEPSWQADFLNIENPEFFCTGVMTNPVTEDSKFGGLVFEWSLRLTKWLVTWARATYRFSIRRFYNLPTNHIANLRLGIIQCGEDSSLNHLTLAVSMSHGYVACLNLETPHHIVSAIHHSLQLSLDTREQTFVCH